LTEVIHGGEQHIASVRPGDHLCGFYTDESQHRESLALYLTEGLSQGQKVLCIYSNFNPSEILGCLDQMNIASEAMLASGQFVFQDARAYGVRAAAFDPTAALDYLDGEIDAALAAGYPALRVSAEMNWARASAVDPSALIKYETNQNTLSLGKHLILFCHYDRSLFDASFLLEVLQAHPLVLFQKRVYPNIHYVPTKAASSDFASAWLDNCLNSLISTSAISREFALPQKIHRSEEELERYRLQLEAMVEQRTEELQLEIHERQQMEEVLVEVNAVMRESEERYRALVQQAPLSILVIQDSRIVFANPAAVTLLGYADTHRLIGLPVFDVVAPVSRGPVLDSLQRIDQGLTNQPAVVGLLNCAGNPVYSEVITVPILYESQSAALLIGQDVSERIRYQEELQSSLADKEVMLREIHHRVKNNLSVIVALISLQEESYKDPAVTQVFKDLQTRVYSMALVHESLYRSPNLARVDFASYLRTLTAHLHQVYARSDTGFGAMETVYLRVEAEDVALKIDTAIPCGLIVNEMVTNALKYAYPPDLPVGSMLFEINISLTKKGDEITLKVSDDGVGFPPDMNWHTAPTLGLQMVQVLARQLKARLELAEQCAGVCWVLTFRDLK
jgi:PAS domain S-box-containing protein